MSDCGTITCDLYESFDFDFDKMEISWDELLTGTATSTWINDGYVEMKALVQNDRAVRQTKQYFDTKTSKFKRCLFTMVLNLIDDNGYTSRVGSFDDHDDKVIDSGGSGIFFEFTDNVLYAVVRYGTINNGTDTQIVQNNFNINNLIRDSHISINEWTKIYTYEILYSDTGQVEWAIYLDGERILLHKIQNITRILNLLPRFSLPLRVEITKNDNDGGATIGEMRHFNSSICYQSDGGGSGGGGGDDDKLCKDFICHLSDITDIQYNLTNASYKPMFSVRLKPAYIRSTVRFYEVLHLIYNHQPFMFAIVRNATFIGLQPSWANPNNNCKLEYDVRANNVDTNNLDILYEEMVEAQVNIGSKPSQSLLINRLCFPPILADIEGNSDILTIVAKKKTPPLATLNFGFRWIEEN